MIYRLTKGTQNRWGSEVCKFFYDLFEDYLNTSPDLKDHPEYERLCWRFAYDTATLLHRMKTLKAVA